jgi:phage/plasmid-like protein (TIGR03299 family)
MTTTATRPTTKLVGYTEAKGDRHYLNDGTNSYPGAIPVEDVHSRLFNFDFVEGEITATHIGDDGVLSFTDPTRKAIMRADSGHIMGIFKQGFVIHPYQTWLVNYVENILDADLAISSAGLLSDGARAWVQIEMKDTLEVEGVEYRPYLTAATSVDGSLSTTYLSGTELVICTNMVSAHLSGRGATGKFKVRHSRNSIARLQDARDALGIIHATAEDYAEQVRELVQIKVTAKEFRKFLDAYLDLTDDKKEKGGRALTIATNKADALTDMWNHDARVTPWKGTAFGVVQAVNTYDQHMLSVRGDRAERNMARAITGDFDKLDANTLATLQGVLV